ncbi:hypothetical protein FFB58_22325 [Enterobacter sp. MF024]|nr:hypothetical protein FFB58_22325 [Enterobacter sp. MF024]
MGAVCLPGGASLARPTRACSFVGRVRRSRHPAVATARPDALTPALSHREREQTLKTATRLPFCIYLRYRSLNASFARLNGLII